MTFSKAANLLRVADMATSRYDGIRLKDVTDEFGCDHRTAQRMMRAFETVFPQALSGCLFRPAGLMQINDIVSALLGPEGLSFPTLGHWLYGLGPPECDRQVPS